MAKSTKTETSDDQDTKPKAEVSEDVVEAEVIEEISETPSEAQDDAAEADPDSVPDDAEATETDSESDAEAQDTLDAPAEDASAEAAPMPQTQSSSRGGFVPLLIGGVIAGGLGFGASQYLGTLSSQPDPAMLALQEQLQTQTEALETLQAQDARLTQDLQDNAASGAGLQASLDGLTASLANVNQQFDDVAAALAGMDARIIELEKRPLTQGLPSNAIEAYERELDELKASVATQRAEAQAMEENAKLTAQQALARAALTRVLSALDAGQPFRAPLNDLVTATGAPAPAELDGIADTGAPSLASLQASFPEFARTALATARRDSEDTGNRLLSFMQQQLGARSVTPQEGNDPDAVLSRAEAAIQNGNLSDALAELDALAEAAKADMAPWMLRAQTRQSALAAGEALSLSLNSN